MKNNYGIISILIFVVYILFLQISKYYFIEQAPILKIILGLILTISGIIFGIKGVKSKNKYKLSLVATILNALGLVSFLSGIIGAFLKS